MRSPVLGNLLKTRQFPLGSSQLGAEPIRPVIFETLAQKLSPLCRMGITPLQKIVGIYFRLHAMPVSCTVNGCPVPTDAQRERRFDCKGRRHLWHQWTILASMTLRPSLLSKITPFILLSSTMGLVPQQ